MNIETTIETKLLIIPAQDVDEIDIMEREEEISEMVSCFLIVSQTFYRIIFRYLQLQLDVYNIPYKADLQE